LPTPPIFRKWAAISAIAGALERKCWVRVFGMELYPNLYTILVGGPAVGKTVAATVTEKLWRGLPEHFVSPTSLTKAALIDALVDARRRVVRPGLIPPYVEFNSLLVYAGELAVLIPAYDNEFMNVLTAVFDGTPYGERRRTKDLKLSIDFPQFNILGATTPSYLNSVLPEGAWDQGFLSRVMLIYSGEREIKPLFDEPPNDEGAFKTLLSDLSFIGNKYGKFGFSPEAASAMGAWHMAGGPPQPEHPKLTNYLGRRTVHLLKLCMVASVSDSDDFIITIDHYQKALDWLLEAESNMPDIFRSMNTGGDSKAIEDCWYFVYSIFVKEKRPIAEHRVFAFLRERIPSHSVGKVLEVMVRSNVLKQHLDGGVITYSPVPRQAR